MFDNINDSRIVYNGNIPKNTYHQYCKNYYSQNGEDGIIEQLLKELNITENGYSCEFGASDGVFSSNTHYLIKNKNYNGLFIENNNALFNKLKETYSDNTKVSCYNETVTGDNLKKFLKLSNFPSDFDLLSIDIDSYDYEIWEKFDEYTPKIVIIEANSYRDPLIEETNNKPTRDYERSVDPLNKYFKSRIAVGSSFMSLIKLGLSKNYIPVSFTGNIIFVHNSVINQIKNFPYIISNNPYDYLPLYTNLVMWDDKWYTNTLLIFNTSIRNYFLKFKNVIGFDWVYENMIEYNYSVWDYNY